MNIEIKEQNGSYLGILSGWIDTAEATQFLEDCQVGIYLQSGPSRSATVEERECCQRR